MFVCALSVLNLDGISLYILYNSSIFANKSFYLYNQVNKMTVVDVGNHIKFLIHI